MFMLINDCIMNYVTITRLGKRNNHDIIKKWVITIVLNMGVENFKIKVYHIMYISELFMFMLFNDCK